MCVAEIPKNCEKELGESLFLLVSNYENVNVYLDQLFSISLRFSPENINLACCKFWNSILTSNQNEEFLIPYKTK